MSLSDAKLRTLKPAAKQYKVSDSGGLHILVGPSGSRLWRLSYRYLGKQKTIALGSYPVVTLASPETRRGASSWQASTRPRRASPRSDKGGSMRDIPSVWSPKNGSRAAGDVGSKDIWHDYAVASKLISYPISGIGRLHRSSRSRCST